MGRYVGIFVLALTCSCGGASANVAVQENGDVDVEIGAILHLEGEVEAEVRADYPGGLLRRIGNTGRYSLRPPRGRGLATSYEDLLADPRIRSVEPDHVGSSPEGDPSGAAILGGDLLASIAGQPGLRAAGFDPEADLPTGQGVTVAVLDTGADLSHPYLAGAFGPGYDFVDDDNDPSEERNGIDEDGDGRVDGGYGHGTFVASLILAIAPDARILPVRILDAEGFGHSSSIAMAIYWAVDRQADVINISVDLPGQSSVVRDAVMFAEASGVIVVGAAGNRAAPHVAFPAEEPTVVATAALDEFGIAAPFTNHGARIAISAPGVEMIGAYPSDESPEGTARWSGTSFAAPIVAGAAALARESERQLMPTVFRDRLAATARPIDADNPTLAGRLGAGLLDVAAVAR